LYGTDATLSGSVSGTTGTFTYLRGTDATFTGSLYGAGASFTGPLYGTDATLTGTVSGTTGTFTYLRGTDATFSGSLYGAGATFTGSLYGTDATFTGIVSGKTGTFTYLRGTDATFTGSLYGAGATFTGSLYGTNATLTGTMKASTLNGGNINIGESPDGINQQYLTLFSNQNDSTRYSTIYHETNKLQIVNNKGNSNNNSGIVFTVRDYLDNYDSILTLTANYVIHDTGVTGPGRVEITRALHGTDATFTGTVSGKTGRFDYLQVVNGITLSGPLYGTDATLTGTVSGTTGTFTYLRGTDATFTGSLYGTDATFTGTVSGKTGRFDYLRVESTRIAIGNNAGITQQLDDSVAIGKNAGNDSQGKTCVAIGIDAGSKGQGYNTNTTYEGAVAIGGAAGKTDQGLKSVAIGMNSGTTTQGAYSVAIGTGAGTTTQQNASIAIGADAGSSNQQTQSSAIGNEAGRYTQGQYSVAIGKKSAFANQGLESVAIGNEAGYTFQGQRSVAIGSEAGASFQGQYSVAIGANAGKTSQAANSIILNADSNGTELNSSTSGFFVSPVVDNSSLTTTSSVLTYNTSSKSIQKNDKMQIYKDTVSNTIFFEMYDNTNTDNLSSYAKLYMNGGEFHITTIGGSAAKNPTVKVFCSQGLTPQLTFTFTKDANNSYKPLRFPKSETLVGIYGEISQLNNDTIISNNTDGGRIQFQTTAPGPVTTTMLELSKEGATFYGPLYGTDATFTGTVSGKTGRFDYLQVINGITLSGPLYGTDATFTGTVSGTTGTFTYLRGTDATFSGNVYVGGVKTFVIDHPINPKKYLVHACLEGPESAVYYRGKGTIYNNVSTTIQLPDYVESLATDFSIQITPIYNGTSFTTYNVSEVVNNEFHVYGLNGSFFWLVHGRRHTIHVEPDKSSVSVRGDGPYTWIPTGPE
jgi:hypothetical protein